MQNRRAEALSASRRRAEMRWDPVRLESVMEDRWLSEVEIAKGYYEKRE
jgi:hypothetical protein